MDRRRFLGLAAAAIVGFDPLTRRWVTAHERHRCSFDEAPHLDGALLLDDAAREAVSRDKGNIFARTPCAVLRPGSVHDIAAMIAFCEQRAIPVSARGMVHTTHGHSLTDGLVIDNTARNRIHEIGEHSAVVDTGCSWKQLIVAAFEEGKTVPSITGYSGLSIGGTLSVGGIGGVQGSTTHGMQIDHVRELEVVTGSGEVVECSERENGQLFEAVLAGLGQFGVMTRARIDLVPAKQRVRRYRFHYLDFEALFSDFRALRERRGIGHVITLWAPPGLSVVPQLEACAFYDLNDPPDDFRLTAGLSAPPQAIVDNSYLDYVQEVDNVVDALRASVRWDDTVKPWFDVWLPDRAGQRFITEVAPSLTREDLGIMGFHLIFAQRRSKLTRPFLPVPQPDGSDWIWLYDILTVSNTPDPGEEYIARMRRRNNSLYRLARDRFGGVRYAIGSVDFEAGEWQRHFGDAWPAFAAAKRRFDPGHIMGRGLGIFN